MARLQPEFRSAQELTDDDFAAIAAIARRQAALRDSLKDALLAGDDLRALGVARELVGLEKKVREQ
jgi:hypothetical protein